jgi:hypothetical protein
MAALSFLVYLTPAQAITRLQERARWLRQNIADLRGGMSEIVARVQRINLIESEYLCAMREAELAWIEATIAQLRAGNFAWDLGTILRDIRRAARTRPQAPKED